LVGVAGVEPATYGL